MIKERIKNFKISFSTKAIIILVAFTALCSFVLVKYAQHLSDPIPRLQKLLTNHNYISAVEIYNNKIFGTDDEEIFNEVFLELILETVDSWSSGELDYKIAAKSLETFSNISNTSIANKAKKEQKRIVIEGENTELYLRAEDYFYERNYIEAMAIAKDINPEYSQYKASSDLYDDCKIAVLTLYSTANSIEGYNQAIAYLEKCFTKTNDIDFENVKKSVEHNLSVFKYAVNIVGKAEQFYDKKDYANAFTTIKDGLSQYPTNNILIEANTIMEEMYVVTIAQQVKTACGKNDYKTALAIINEAIDNHNCEDFKLIKESVRAQDDVIYRTFKNIRDKINVAAARWKSEDFNVKKVAEETGAYIVKSGEKLVLGDYSDEEITVLSFTGNVVASIANLDLIADVRDLVYDVQHINEEDHIVLRLATDVVAILPVIGVVKYLKYTDEIKDATKASTDIIDQIVDGGKTNKKIADLISTTKTSDKISDAIDNASDTAKQTENAAESAKDIANHYKTNKDLAGTYVEGVLFQRRKLTYSDGRKITGVFPKFDAHLNFKLDPAHFKSTAATHKAHAIKYLQEEIKTNKSLAKKFTAEQIDQINNNILPKEFVWHHSEEEGVLQLVDRAIHEKVPHTGGMSLWGRRYNN